MAPPGGTSNSVSTLRCDFTHVMTSPDVGDDLYIVADWSFHWSDTDR